MVPGAVGSGTFVKSNPLPSSRTVMLTSPNSAAISSFVDSLILLLRHAGNRHECPEQYSEAADEFGEYGQPCHQVRSGGTHPLKNGGKHVGSPGQLREPVLHKPISNDQPQGNGGPPSHWKPGQQSKKEIA